MKYLPVAIVAILTFGICYLADAGFKKLFRSKSQHKSGLSVKAGKSNAIFGILLMVVGLGALCSSSFNGILRWIAGPLMVLVGLFLIGFYVSFGIYYDDESFLYSRLGRRSKTYKYRDIKSQQLFVSGSNMIIELHLSDGLAIQLQSSMAGFDSFMNKAFEGWISQLGKCKADCAHYDPQKYSWFPNAQEE